VTARSLPLPFARSGVLVAFVHWLRSHRATVAMAGLLAFAAPVTFFTGAVSVMREPQPADVTMLAAWWLVYGMELWLLLLLIGYLDLRLDAMGRSARIAVWLVCGLVAAACVNLSTAGRAAILVEQGVVRNALTMHLNSSVFSLTMALLFFAHLRRSRRHEAAAARLARAQVEQREARQRMVHGRLQAVQARIDPLVLFEMLDAVRRSYETDAARAERLLDELILFLRAALPRLRTSSSSVPREAELARAYARLRALAGATGVRLDVDLATDVVHARFPPGVLLPLLDDVLRVRPGACTLTAARSAADCRLVLQLPGRPTDAVLARVRALLADLYGAQAEVTLEANGGGVNAIVKVPHELA
jgi:hypothetical protein